MTAGADPYLPGHGDLGFDVLHYDLQLDYRIESNHLSGHATIRAVALEAADGVALDLHALTVTKVTVDGAKPRRYQHRRDRLVVHPSQALLPGQEFTLTVSYHGHPAPVPGPAGPAGWEELVDGVIVAAQPHGSPSWFPCNDRPSNKATYRLEVAAATAYAVTANGELTSVRRGASRTTWTYEQREPMATYLATVQIGRYQTRTLATTPVRVAVERSMRLGARADRATARQAEMVQVFTSLFGPYPFGRYTVVFTDDDLEIPLESQTLSTFGANHATTGWESERLVAHELAHQWFGNSLTLRHWRDIWLHEGFACYAEWLWSERSGGRTAHDLALEHWTKVAAAKQDLVLADPTPAFMFDDRVYKRGALLLHALRLHMGDEAFFDMVRSWSDEHVHGSVTTGMFIAHAVACAGRPAERLLDRWLFDTALPALPAS